MSYLKRVCSFSGRLGVGYLIGLRSRQPYMIRSEQLANYSCDKFEFNTSVADDRAQLPFKAEAEARERSKKEQEKQSNMSLLSAASIRPS